MKLTQIFAAAAATMTLATPAMADIMIMDPYARASSSTAKAGAAFMMIHNTGDTDDQLLSVSSEIAARTELHTHMENDDGVMSMVHIEDGFSIPAGGMVHLMRGGKHVMFMGLTEGMVDGENFDVTLIFRDAGEITVTIPVDLDRQPEGGHTHNH